MPTIKLNTKQWAAYYERLGKNYWPAVVRGAKSGALRGKAFLQKRTDDAGALDRGGYKRGWMADVFEDRIVFYNDRSYAGVIEFGRRPGRRPPPSDRLVPWVSRKLGIGAAEAKSVAFLVARAIGRKGTPGRYILTGAVNDLKWMIEEEILREVQGALNG